MNEITKWTAVETAIAIRNKSVSIHEVTEAHLTRAEQLNHDLNALTVIDHDMLQLAREMDNDPTISQDSILRGVPVTTKINVDQRGFANSNGLPAFKDNICKTDSAVVKNLRDSGAMIIGRTNTPEFSMRWCTSNPLHGVSKNPWNDNVTPGGSSGAGAAAVASGIGTIAHGNDLGGSLRYPAFCCGIAAIRPSMGRVPTYNPDASTERPPLTQTMSVQGPMARTIADVRLGLRAMSRPSVHDPLYHCAPDSGRTRHKPMKIGYAHNPFSASGAHRGIANAVDKAVQGLRDAGFELVEMPFVGADRGAQLWGELLFTETRSLMEPAIREFGSKEMNTLYESYRSYFSGLELDAFIAGLAERLRLQRQASEMLDTIDCYLMPTSLIPPFENDLDFKSPEAIPDIIDAQKPLHLINLLGLPSVAIPTGLDDGIPIGVQLVGAMHDDWLALDIAEHLEREIGTLL